MDGSNRAFGSTERVSRFRLHPLALVVALAAVSGPLMAQDSVQPRRDSTTPRVNMRAQPQITVEKATVVAFAESLPPASDSIVATWRNVVQRLGFTLQLAPGLPPVVIDKRFNTLHFTPLDVHSGFVLVVPGARSQLVRSLVAPDSLEREIRAYLAAARPFSR
jgi:hypothetical protein